MCKHISILLALIVMSMISNDAQGQVSDAVEKSALIAFYDKMGGTGWLSETTSDGKKWNLDKLKDPSTTFADFDVKEELTGIVITNGDVTQISFGANKLIGGLPSELANLTMLEKISIPGSALTVTSRNQLIESLPDLSSLKRLVTLYLPLNDCSGASVTWLGALPSLKKLNLSSQSGTLSVKLKIVLGSSISGLQNLTSMDLSNNTIVSAESAASGTIDGAIASLDKLDTLILANCGLVESSFPIEFGGMDHLRSLNMYGNPIVNVPACFGDFDVLSELILSAVSLRTLPSNMNKLEYLEKLDLSENSLSNLDYFDDLMNNLIGCKILTKIDLSHNGLIDVSKQFNEIKPVRTLDLSFNPIANNSMSNITGSQVSTLILQVCNLTTSIPSSLVNLSGLTSLDISNSILGINYDLYPNRNQLNLTSSDISSVLTALKSLTTLNMGWHCVVEPTVLPEWFGTGTMSGLENLFISSNGLSFQLDPDKDNLKKLVNLKQLYMGDNRFGESFPAYFETSLSNLEILEASGNLFSGDVPDFFVTGMSHLKELGLNSNYFTGIPSFVGRSNRTSFSLSIKGNFLDVIDLDPFFTSSGCATIVSKFICSPQRRQLDPIGEPATFYVVETLDIALQFSVPGKYNVYTWYKGESQIFPLATGTSYKVTNASALSTGVYHTRITHPCLSQLEDVFRGADIQLILIPPLCQSELPARNGMFKLDKLTGSIVFEREDCPTMVPVTCVFGPVSPQDNVVSASAVTYSDQWSYRYLGIERQKNPFENNERGKWRPLASYTYSSPIDQSRNKNFNGGTFQYKPFNWRSGAKSNYPGWLKVNQIERYNSNGDPVEERNVLNVPSVAKFGYGGVVPYLMAQNAEYNSVLFESFEMPGPKLEDGVSVDATALDGTFFHSGKKSLRLVPQAVVSLRSFTLTNHIKIKGLLSRVWVKGSVINTLALQAVVGTATYSAKFIRVASSGEWALYEAVLSPTLLKDIAVNAKFDVKIKYSDPTATIWLDDVRVQPKDSEMLTYVYDPTSLRLLTTFDDQHFGMFFQYNAEGKLVRKIVETERGKRTLQETQYNTPKQNKDN